jgi:hypothetical protein
VAESAVISVAALVVTHGGVVTGGTTGNVLVIDRGFVSVLMPSLTCTVKLAVPAVVGVPVMAPVKGSSDNTGGRAPADIDQV